MAKRSGTGEVLVGRANELCALEESLQRARSGQAQVVIIDSEPGMGKTALLTSFLTDACGVGDRLWVRCDEFEQTIRFGALSLLLGQEQPASYSTVDAGRRVLARLSRSPSDETVTVLAVDDAHWMDQPSAEALRFALRRLRFDRILAVLARRSAATASPNVLTEDPAATIVIRPEPLDAGSVRQLARRLRSWQLSPELAKSVVQRTGGVPLLVTAVIRGARDAATLGEASGASVTDAANRMLISVDPDSRRLVQAAAVLAEPTELVVLRQVAEIADPATALTSALRAGLLRRSRLGAVDCTHDLLREAVYEALPDARRRELHARAAAVTTGDRALAHRATATDEFDPELVCDLEAAAERARRAMKLDLAASHRLRARSVCGDPDQREQLLLEALIERVEAQDLVGADELAEAAQAAAPRALRSLALGLLARESGRVREARSLLHQALDLTASGGKRRLRERAAVALAVLEVRLNEGREAVVVLGQAEGTNDPELAGDLLATKGIALWESGRLPEALELLRHVDLSRDGAPWEADLLGVRGMLHLYRGQLPEAHEDFDRAVDLAHLWRHSTNGSRTYALRCMTRFYRGDWDGAAVDAAAARALAEVEAQPWSLPVAHAVSIAVPAHRGQWSVAAEHLARAQEASALLRSPQVANTVSQQETLLAWARRDFTAVVRITEPLRSESYLEWHAAASPYRWVMPARICALIALGRLDEAEREIATYDLMVNRWPDGPVPAGLPWLRGLVAEARGEERLANKHYEDALLDPTLAGVPFAHAQLLYALGRLHRARGNRREAVDRLAQAKDIFARLRAEPFLERCRGELAACGLPSSASGPLALTQREEDVASLVVRGLSNKEVAAELFLTSRTVEYHLRNIYAKLGISTRHELRRLRIAS